MRGAQAAATYRLVNIEKRKGRAPRGRPAARARQSGDVGLMSRKRRSGTASLPDPLPAADYRPLETVTCGPVVTDSGLSHGGGAGGRDYFGFSGCSAAAARGSHASGVRKLSSEYRGA